MENTSVKNQVQIHLFEHPLYNWTDQNADNMCVVVCGNSAYAYAFVDVCLQAGQMIEQKLLIYWCIDDEGTPEKYLAARPELSSFVDVTIAWSRQEEGGSLP